MTNGIYGFWDSKKGYYAYIGRFTGKKRVIAHYLPSQYDVQTFNRVLQNNPDRYEERILMEGDYNDWQLNQMEKLCIKYFKTFYYDYPERSVFNFTRGGEGTSGYRKLHEDFVYTVSKAGFSCQEKQQYCVRGINQDLIKQSIDKDFIEELVEKLNAGEITEEEAKAMDNFKYTVSKDGFSRQGKQYYCVRDRNHFSIKTSIDKDFIEELVEKLNAGKIMVEEAKVIKRELPFEYTVAKAGLGRNGNQKYRISDRNDKSIKTSINKKALDEIAVALNNGEITEGEAKGIDLNPFEYTVSKAGKHGFKIYDRSNLPIKTCKDKSKLEPIATALNNGEITEEEAKAIDLNPFRYTVVKAGRDGFTICDRTQQGIKTCKDKSKLEPIATALNNGEITEEEVKSVRGVDKVLEMLNK